MLSKIKRFFTKKRGKTGASLLVVIVTVTMLIVMGTTFGMIAMTAYNNSNRRLCQQQAYFTAEACLNVLQKIFAEDKTKVFEVADKLSSIYDAAPNNIRRTDESITYKVAQLGGMPTNSTDASLAQGVSGLTTTTGSNAPVLQGLLGECAIWATYADDEGATIRLTAIATYQGFSESLSARIACTTDGALELRKVFSNSQSWDVPIVTLIADKTSGDMYFSSPGTYDRWPNGEIKDNETNRTLNSTIYSNIPSGQDGVVVHTKPFGIDNKPLHTPQTRCVPMEIIKPINDKLIQYYWYTWENQTSKKNNATREYIATTKTKLNKYVNDEPLADTKYVSFYLPADKWANLTGPQGEGIYCKTQDHWQSVKYGAVEGITAGWGDVVKEHINVARTGTATQWYNDWVEIYMYSGDNGGVTATGAKEPAVINGDMYVNSRALIGLYDKNRPQTHFWSYLDTETDAGKVERKFVSHVPYNGNFFNKSGYLAGRYYNGYETNYNFEHGASENVFFDYAHFGTGTNPPPTHDASTCSHNGNMFLFDDARIECYDSTHTPNARNAIKNNIFAHKNLVLDGFACDEDMDSSAREATGDVVKSKKNVKVYGDVMVEGDLTIADSIIYGDVYCNGDQLFMYNSMIYGNVFFNGARCKIERTQILGDEKTELVSNPGAPMITLAGKSVTHYSFETDEGKCIQLGGGDLFILGHVKNEAKMREYYHKYDPEGIYNETTDDADKTHKADYGTNTQGSYDSNRAQFMADSNNSDLYTSVLTNTSVSGIVYSKVNLRVKTAYWMYAINLTANAPDDWQHDDSAVSSKALQLFGKDRDERTGRARPSKDIFGSIYCDGYLFLDAVNRYQYVPEDGDTNYERDNRVIALFNNRIDVKNVVMAQKLMVRQVLTNENDANGTFSQTENYKKGYHYSNTGNINIHLNKVYVGKGGCFINGNEMRWSNDNGGEGDGTRLYYQKGHKSIEIKEFYSQSTNPHATAFWNFSGGIATNTEICDEGTNYTFNTAEVHLCSPNDYAGSHIEAGHIATLFSSYDDTDETMRGNFVEGIKADIVRDSNNRVADFGGTLMTTDNIAVDATSVSSIITAMEDYLATDKLPKRTNAYYTRKADAMRYIKGYKSIADMRDWANVDAALNADVGPYPRYRPNATLGVWREIKILKWSAPEVYKINIDELTGTKTYVEKNGQKVLRAPTYRGPGGQLSLFALYTWQEQEMKKGAIKNRFIQHKSDADYVIKGNFNIMPSTEGGLAPKLVVSPGETLTFNTAAKKNNMHCVLEGGMSIGENAQIVLKGGNMTFLYLGKGNIRLMTDDPNATPPTVGNNTDEILTMGDNAKVGIVTSGQEEILKRDSIYFIANARGTINIGRGASLTGYIYAPNCFMEVEKNAAEVTGKIEEGTVNTVLTGSMLIKGLKTNMTLTHDEILLKYKNLTYRYVTAPLILDQNIQYGDTGKDVIDYADANWGFIGYD